MKSPSLPKNEIQRLLALKQYQILDTNAEESFDDITSLASLICGTPIALITLLDETRQWFKSSYGLDSSETPREFSFCGHAILGDEVFEIPNAIEDERFTDNPLVAGDPNIRFYAGYPLITSEGYALGTLCVIDQSPGKLNHEQKGALKKLGKQVVHQIEHRFSIIKLEEMASILERTGQMAKVGGWELDLSNTKLQWTKEVFAIHEIDPDQTPALEDAISFYAPAGRPVITAAIENAIANGSSWDIELPLITAKGRDIWVRAQGSVVLKNGKASKLAGVFQDITQRKKIENDLAWVNRALLMLSECNETLIHMTDETKLIKEICRIIVEVGGYRMAWVGYAENDQYKSIKPQAHYGYNKDFLENINLSWSTDDIKGLGPGGKTIRNGKAVIVEDIMTDPSYPVKSEAFQQGFLALISLPLKNKDHTFGLLGMYTDHVRKFGDDEVRLLQDLADNLAAGIINIRAEKERQHLNNTMLKLAKSVSATRGEVFFEQLVRNMVDTVEADAGYMAQLIRETSLRGRTVAALVDGELVEDFEYLIPTVTLQRLFGSSDLIIVPNHANLDFSGVSMMRFYPYQAFAGLCLYDSNGLDIGLLFVFFRNPIETHSYDLIKSTLKIFAARAASELQRLEADNRIQEQAALLDKTNDPIVVRDLDQNVTYWNKAAEALYGWAQAEVLYQPIYLFLKQDMRQLEDIMQQVLLAGEWVGEIVEYHKNGTPLIIETHLTLVRDAQGKPKSVFAIKTDISKRKLAEEEIRLLAFYDPLTKLPNRRLLMDRLERALTITARSKQFGAVIFIDLDNFKILNDTLGHDKGDYLLKEMAERLKNCVRDSDTVSRFGGDEFVMILEGLHHLPEEAKEIARNVGEKILDSLNHSFDFEGYQHLSTPSIGIALFSHETVGVDELLKQADTAMYKSKVAGRNRMTFYECGPLSPFLKTIS
jgi:diguanylate cyclase (GGDEF)-like protein/PAS domain S-box-containing protein